MKAEKQKLLRIITGILLIPLYVLPVMFPVRIVDVIYSSLAIAAVLYIIELTVTLTGKLTAFAFLPFDAAALVIAFGGILVRTVTDPEFYTAADDMNMAILFLFGTRALLLTVDFIRSKKAKLIPLAVVGVVSVYAALIFTVRFIEPAVVERFNGTADKTGSWGQISESVEKLISGKRIVTDSRFNISETDYGNFPVMDGSTVCVPMAIEFAMQHTGLDYKTVEHLSDFSTTHHAYRNLIMREEKYGRLTRPSDGYVYRNFDGRTTDIIFATFPSEEELQMAKDNGVELITRPVCYDAFVFITHKNNPVDNLSSDDIRKIYSGEINNWSELGGKDKDIIPYQREANSGSQTAMEKLIMGGSNMIPPESITVITGMGDLVDRVAEYRNSTAALGYTYKYYIDVLYKNDNIKILSVDGVYPDDENIRSGVYPYTTNYYGVIRKGDENKTGGKFLDWVLSDEGQKCIELAGYIPMG